MPAHPSTSEPLRLKIEPFVGSAQELAARVKAELPTHSGLGRAADAVAAAALEADRVSRAMRRPYSLHRLPVLFLAAALICLGVWVYWRFFHVSTLTLALPDRDAAQLREQVALRQRVNFRPLEKPGSREALAAVDAGEVDLAFVQGGLEIPHDLPRLETPSPELVLWFVRDRVASLQDVRRVLTSLEGEGSHTVAQRFFAAWGMEGIKYQHDWRTLTMDARYQIPPDIDAAFVVKDPSDNRTLIGAERLADAGFRLATANLGARAQKLDFLKPARIAPGYLRTSPALPGAEVTTYDVKTYLVARRGLTPRLLAQAGHVLDAGPMTITEGEFDPSATDTSELFQGIDAFMGILVNIGLAFLALLGLDAMACRKQFHELNSLVSLLSMLQSNKDVLGLEDPRQRQENLLYLGLVSDLLGLISMISSYYTQENSSLLFNNLSEVIHQRCSGLKINIQLKILHATVELPKLPKAAAPQAPGNGSAAAAGDKAQAAPDGTSPAAT